MSEFVGRVKELKRLHMLMQQKRSSIVVIKGRRRIGKSRLASEFAKISSCKFFSFTGLAPDPNISAQQQLDHFANQLCLQVGIPNVTFRDWNDAFNTLSFYLTAQPTLILLDEISWLGDKDPTFVSKLKVWWDLKLSLLSNIMLILCGSVSIWIEENIINSTALFGRIALILTLEPFSLRESYQYLRIRGYKGSMYDIYKILAVTGGVPWYLEQISPRHMASDNIQQLCFTPGGVLVGEYKRIVNDLFTKKGLIYKKILESLKDGSQTLHDIRQTVNYGNSGTISMYMEHLVISGFVRKHAQWSLNTGKVGKQKLYSLSDPYIRFYLKYIQPRLAQIDDGKLENINLNSLPGFDVILGLQMESLLLQNRELILQALDIANVDCVNDNPYIQKTTSRKKGCQIDYLIQTRNRNLFVCEFKFRLHELPVSILQEMREKIARFSVPRNFAIIPVLFHIGGVVASVEEQDYFYRIIDLSILLEHENHISITNVF